MTTFEITVLCNLQIVIYQYIYIYIYIYNCQLYNVWQKTGLCLVKTKIVGKTVCGATCKKVGTSPRIKKK